MPRAGGAVSSGGKAGKAKQSPWSGYMTIMAALAAVVLMAASMHLLVAIQPRCEEQLAAAEHRIEDLERHLAEMEQALSTPAPPKPAHQAKATPPSAHQAKATPPRAAPPRAGRPHPKAPHPAAPAPPPSPPRPPPAPPPAAFLAAAPKEPPPEAPVDSPPQGCQPRNPSDEDAGYADNFRGWYDVQGCGYCFDYCRWVGDSGPGGDPSVRMVLGTSWWSCRLAGQEGAKTPKDKWSSWTFARCDEEGSAVPPPGAPRAPATEAPAYVANPEYDAVLATQGSGPRITEERLKVLAAERAIGVVVVVCKRPKYLERTMASILKSHRDPAHFPLVISQDAHDPAMTSLVESKYVSPGIAFRINHEHEGNAEEIAKTYGKIKNTLGYVRIAQHFGFAMRNMFDVFGFEAVIFIEEDMEVSPDFFQYFDRMRQILQVDQDMFCVSAWNDNGYESLVLDPTAVYRTDFFPGLGWMMDRRMWGEVRDHWALAFWDEFMRRPDVRRGRHCIRPDVSRSYTFGSEGTSAGQFFNQHLSKIKLNTVDVDWTAEDLNHLSTSGTFDDWLTTKLKEAHPSTMARLDATVAMPEARERGVRIMYAPNGYVEIAKKYSLMEDEKEGIRRMSYRGVIPFAWKGVRIYLYTTVWPGDLD